MVQEFIYVQGMFLVHRVRMVQLSIDSFGAEVFGAERVLRVGDLFILCVSS